MPHQPELQASGGQSSQQVSMTSRAMGFTSPSLGGNQVPGAGGGQSAPVSPSSMARISWRSPDPSDCAVNATVLMRRKANSQNRQSKITDAIATPPSKVASPSRPIAVVETMPISGVVRFAIIAGPAMAKTCAVVTLAEGFKEGPLL